MATEDSARIRLPARRISLSLAGSRVRPPSHSMSRRTPSSSAFVYVPGTGKEEDQFLSKWPAPSTTAINRVAKRWPFGFRCNERWRSKVCPVSYVVGYDESGLSLVCNRLTRFGLPFSNRPLLDHHWWDQFQKEFFRRKSAFPNIETNRIQHLEQEERPPEFWVWIWTGDNISLNQIDNIALVLFQGQNSPPSCGSLCCKFNHRFSTETLGLRGSSAHQFDLSTSNKFYRPGSFRDLSTGSSSWNIEVSVWNPQWVTHCHSRRTMI